MKLENLFALPSFLGIWVFLFLCSANPALAEDILSIPASAKPRFTIQMNTLSRPRTNIPDLAGQAQKILESTFEELNRVFQSETTETIAVRFVERDQFLKNTGAPTYVGAMYYKGLISIPVAEDEKIEINSLRRSLRHEIVHAFVAARSSERCPAWLDEGLAQLLGGREDIDGESVLLNRMKQQGLFRFADFELILLSTDKKRAIAGYQQALFATNTLVNRFGMKRIRNFFGRLRQGSDIHSSFAAAFDVSYEDFENQVRRQLDSWRVKKGIAAQRRTPQKPARPTARRKLPEPLPVLSPPRRPLEPKFPLAITA